jgi:hypothetical protein
LFCGVLWGSCCLIFSLLCVATRTPPKHHKTT